MLTVTWKGGPTSEPRFMHATYYCAPAKGRVPSLQASTLSQSGFSSIMDRITA